MAKKIAGNPQSDITMSAVPMELGGKKYHLVLNMGALSLAQQATRTDPNIVIPIDIMRDFFSGVIGADAFCAFLFAAMGASAPEITYEEVKSLVEEHPSDVPAAYVALQQAHRRAMPKPKESDPNADAEAGS